jgi:hypothetical protein
MVRGAIAALILTAVSAGCTRRLLGVDDPGRADGGADVSDAAAADHDDAPAQPQTDARDTASVDLAGAETTAMDAPAERSDGAPESRDAAGDGATEAAADTADALDGPVAPADAAGDGPDATTDTTAGEGPTDAPACDPTPLPDPIVHYTFDDCTDAATNLKDSATTGPADGVRSSGTRCVLGRAGSGSALYFDGQVGAEVTVPVRPSFAITRVTLAGWVRPSHATDSTIIGRWFTHDQWALGFDGNEQAYVFSIAVPSLTYVWGDSFRVAMPAQDATWVHVAATFDGTTLRLYKNGHQAAEQRITDPPRNLQETTKPLTMGYVVKDPPSTEPRFRGDLDDVRIYATALTPAQVARLACGP